MRQQISSSGAFKLFAFSPIFILFLIVFMALSNDTSKPSEDDIWPVVAIIGAVTFFFAYWASGLKRVEIEDNNLIITQTFPRKRKEVVTKLSNIADVYEVLPLRGSFEPIRIEFKKLIVFGKGITFIASHRFTGFSQHPIIDELKQIAKESKHHSKRH